MKVKVEMSNQNSICQCRITISSVSEGHICHHYKAIFLQKCFDKIAQQAKAKEKNSIESLIILAAIAAGVISGNITVSLLENNRIKIISQNNVSISWEGTRDKWWSTLDDVQYFIENDFATGYSCVG